MQVFVRIFFCKMQVLFVKGVRLFFLVVNMWRIVVSVVGVECDLFCRRQTFVGRRIFNFVAKSSCVKALRFCCSGLRCGVLTNFKIMAH